MHRLLEDGKYILVNNSRKCTGGPFTRVDPSDSKIKSCLSLVIISAGLQEFVEELRIDEKREFTPHRAIQKNGKLIFTDHFSLLLKFKNIPMKDRSVKLQRNSVAWNTNKEGGWKRFMDLTSNCEKLEQIANHANHLDPEEMMIYLTRRMEKIKFQSFGKVKIKVQTLDNDKELDKLYDQKNQKDCDEDAINEKINNKLIEYQLKDYERKLKSLNSLKNEKGKSAAVFKLKEKIVGSKKVAQEQVSMKDPVSGELIVENDKLREASVKYVSNLLTNRSPLEDFKEELEIMESLHDLRMKEDINDESSISDEDYCVFLKQIAKKNKDKYQFILKAGKLYHDTLLALYRKVWETESKPSTWKNTTCIQLYKGKGRKDDFNSQRFIHMKEEEPKGFEYLVMNKVKPIMVKNFSKFQIGATP